jgi:hypothetical protein
MQGAASPLRLVEQGIRFANEVRPKITALTVTEPFNVLSLAPVAHNHGIVSVNTPRVLAWHELAGRISLEQERELFLDSRLSLRAEGDPEGGDNGVVGKGGDVGINIVLLTRRALLLDDLRDFLCRPRPRDQPL